MKKTLTLALALVLALRVFADSEEHGSVTATMQETAEIVTLQLSSTGSKTDYSLVAVYDLQITQMPNTAYDHAIYTPEYDKLATLMGCTASKLKATTVWWFHETGQTYLNNNNDNWFKANGERSNYNSANSRMFIQCNSSTGWNLWFGQQALSGKTATAGTQYAGEFFLVCGEAAVKFTFTLNVVESMGKVRYHDLGGMQTTDGHTIKSGLLFRGAELNGEHALPADVQQELKAAGIKAELDMRSDAEALSITASPLGKNVAYKRISNKTYYVDGLKKFPANYKKDFLFVYDNLKKGNPVYYHCIYGVDRTGTLSIMLEGLLGVSKEDIYDDYNTSAEAGIGLERNTTYIDAILAFVETMEGETLKEKFFNYWRLYASVPYSQLVDFRNIVLGTTDDTTEPAWDIDLPATDFGDYPISNVSFANVRVSDRFWAPRIKQNQEVTIPIALQQCYNTGRVDNFLKAAGKKEGYFNTECTFDDTDIYKIIEGISYSIQTSPNASLEATMDELIQDIADAQESDGYIYTARTAGNPEGYHSWVYPCRWEGDPDLSHELYNCGHLFEAAAAHYASTGKTSLLDIATKAADLLVREFLGRGLRYEPGHQIVEMGLVKLYRITGKPEYMALAKYFLDLRGNTDSSPSLGREYCQIHKPVTEQDEAVGHAVRAAYMYSGMTDVAVMMNDADYIKAINTIWQNVVGKKYYITGGIGARHNGEAFGAGYELPNATAYNETCAAIANVYWNWRMFLMNGDSKYYDVIERTLYNGLLSGIGLDGKTFFYPNPLSADFDYSRSEWFGCACCPSNLCRFVPSVPGYIYAHRDSDLYVNLFMDNTATIDMKGGAVTVCQTTDYPFDGEVSITLSDLKRRDFRLLIRKPGWASGKPVPSNLYRYTDTTDSAIKVMVNGEEVAYTMSGGYMVIGDREWQDGDKVSFSLPMDVHKVLAHASVSDDAGRVALERGPIVFALESNDNGGLVSNCVVKTDDEVSYAYNENLLGGVMTLDVTGHSLVSKSGTTSLVDYHITAIPYYAWANRGRSAMEVWIARTESKAVPVTRTVIDAADAGNTSDTDPVGEKQHNLKTSSEGEHVTGTHESQDYRHCLGGGWFSYDLSLAGVPQEDADKVSIVVRYWGADKTNRCFSVMADDVILRQQVLEGNTSSVFVEYEYPLDKKLTEGKDHVTVKFRSVDDATVGGVFYVKLCTGYEPAQRRLTPYQFDAKNFAGQHNVKSLTKDATTGDMKVTVSSTSETYTNIEASQSISGKMSYMPSQYLLVLRGKGFLATGATIWWMMGKNSNLTPTTTVTSGGETYLIWDLRQSVSDNWGVWGNDEVAFSSNGSTADYALFDIGLQFTGSTATISDLAFYSPHELFLRYGSVFTLSDICAWTHLKAGDSFVWDGNVYRVDATGSKVSHIMALSTASGTLPDTVCGFQLDGSGIEDVSQKITHGTCTNGTCFNLAGQKVGTDYHGIVIKDGKKVNNSQDLRDLRL